MNYLYAYAAKVRPLIDWSVDTKETIEDFDKQWGQGTCYSLKFWFEWINLKVNSPAGPMSTRQWRQLVRIWILGSW